MAEDVKEVDEQEQAIVFEDEINKESNEAITPLDSLANDDPLEQLAEEEKKDPLAALAEEIRDDVAEAAQIQEPEQTNVNEEEIQIEPETQQYLDEIVEAKEENEVEAPEPEQTQQAVIEPEIETKAVEETVEAEPTKLEEQEIVFEDDGKETDQNPLESLQAKDPLAELAEEAKEDKLTSLNKENETEDKLESLGEEQQEAIVTEEGSVIVNDAPENQDENTAPVAEEIRDDVAEAAQVQEPEQTNVDEEEIQIEPETQQYLDEIVEAKEGNEVEAPEPEPEQTQQAVIEPEIETKAVEETVEAEPTKLEEQEIVFEDDGKETDQNPLESLQAKDPLAELAEEAKEDKLTSLNKENETEDKLESLGEEQQEAIVTEEGSVIVNDAPENQDENTAPVAEEIRDDVAEAAQVQEPEQTNVDEEEIQIEPETQQYLDEIVEAKEGNEVEAPEPEMALAPKQKAKPTQAELEEKKLQFVPQFVKDEEDKLASLADNKEETIVFEGDEKQDAQAEEQTLEQALAQSPEQSAEQNPEETLAEAKEILAESEEIMVAEGMRTEEEAAEFQQALEQTEQNPEISTEERTAAAMTMVEERAAENENIVIENLDIREDQNHTADENIQIAAMKRDLQKSPDEYGNTDINNPDKFSTAKLVNNAAKLNLVMGRTEKEEANTQEQAAITPEIEAEPIEVTQAKEKLQEKSDLNVMAEQLNKQYGDKVGSVTDIKQSIEDTKAKVYDEQRFPEHLDAKGNLTEEGKEAVAFAAAYDMTDDKLSEEERTKIANSIKDDVGKQLAAKDAEGKNVLQSSVEKNAVLATEKEAAAALIAKHEQEKARAKEASQEQEGQALTAEPPSRDPIQEPIKDSKKFLAMATEAHTQLKQEKDAPSDVLTTQKPEEEINAEDKEEKQTSGRVFNENRGIMAKANTTVDEKTGATIISSDGSAKDTHKAMDQALVANRSLRGVINEENKEQFQDAKKITAAMGRAGMDNEITTTEEHMLETTFKSTKTARADFAHDMNRDIDTVQEAQEAEKTAPGKKNLKQMTPLELAQFMKMRDQKDGGHSGGRET
jgi:hypothetical protein